MDLEDAPEEAAFRAEASAWLTEHATPRAVDHHSVISLYDPLPPDQERAWIKGCRDWQRTKFEGHYAAITWPKEFGGRDGSPMQEIIFTEEEGRFDVPGGALTVTLGTVAPTIRTHGTPQQQSHLRPMLSGDEIWCQLFSEPGAGSDLAGIRTRAVRDGQDWLISGQKVWTSGAHYSDWGYLLARTDPEVPKHEGLTAFLIPMDSPGVTVRPLRQITGGASFNEVFFEDVRVGDDARLDAVGAGWRVAVTTLTHERYVEGGLGAAASTLEALIALARERGLAADPLIRQRLMQVRMWLEAYRYTTYRSMTAISRGESPGPAGSVAKLQLVRVMRSLSETAMLVGGMPATLDGMWSRLYLNGPGVRLGGGTDEVMRNIVGERVLGLPAEPRADRDIPFRDLPV